MAAGQEPRAARQQSPGRPLMSPQKQAGRWGTAKRSPSCDHNPVRLPSVTHQARIPLGLADLGAELLQFQLVHLQVGSGDTSTVGSVWNHATEPHTPFPTPAREPTWDVSRGTAAALGTPQTGTVLGR